MHGTVEGTATVSLADEVAAETPVPKQYQRHADWELGKGGQAATGPTREVVTDHKQLLRLAGLDPDAWRIVGKVSQWTKTHHGKEDTYSFFFQFIPATSDPTEARDLAALIRPTRPRKQVEAHGLPMVVSIADPQIGKDGPDAPTHEVIDARFRAALEVVAHIVKTRAPSMLVLADCGDPIEGITSSAPNQIATNTLELPDQLRLWQRRLTESILSLAPHAGRTVVASVPSNHGEIRNNAGKIGYGDHGLGVARTVEDAFELLGNPHGVTFAYPTTKYDVTTYVDVDGTLVAFTHGHHAKTFERIPQWVANQAASLRSPMRDARIVVHGHFHRPGFTESRGRQIVSCSMFDSGSAWFENLTGEYSAPAITTFNVKRGRVHQLQFIEPEG